LCLEPESEADVEGSDVSELFGTPRGLARYFRNVAMTVPVPPTSGFSEISTTDDDGLGGM
jgi:hypothetical protein